MLGRHFTFLGEMSTPAIGFFPLPLFGSGNTNNFTYCILLNMNQKSLHNFVKSIHVLYCYLNGSVSRDFRPQYCSWFKPIWAPDRQAVFSNSASISPRYSITKLSPHLHGVQHTAETISTVCITPRSQSPRCVTRRGERLWLSLHDSDSELWHTAGSPTLNCATQRGVTYFTNMSAKTTLFANPFKLVNQGQVASISWQCPFKCFPFVLWT